jgi:hypothetical protein
VRWITRFSGVISTEARGAMFFDLGLLASLKLLY